MKYYKCPYCNDNTEYKGLIPRATFPLNFTKGCMYACYKEDHKYTSIVIWNDSESIVESFHITIRNISISSNYYDSFYFVNRWCKNSFLLKKKHGKDFDIKDINKALSFINFI